MTPGDHGAIKLLLDAKVPAVVNGMLLQRARAVGSKGGGGGDYPLQILADTFTLFQEEGRDYFKPIRTKDNIYKKHTH
jgi:hypothetical protein